MILAVCAEEKMGMMFHKRRVSRDRKVCEDLLRMCSERSLYMEAFSAKLFEGAEDRLHLLEEGADICGRIPDGAVFFAENPEHIPEEQVESIVLYRWNRRYPADQYFDICLEEWKLESSEEFAGYSHEKITKEIYVR